MQSITRRHSTPRDMALYMKMLLDQGLRKGRLWLGGAPLLPLGSGLFRIGEEDHEPDRVRFEEVVNGRALRAVFSGIELRRLDA